VTISGIEIHPGTLVCADADGVVAVPAAEAGRIIERIERIEADIAAAARAGSTLRAARETFGYHTLQTRQPWRQRHKQPPMSGTTRWTCVLTARA